MEEKKNLKIGVVNYLNAYPLYSALENNPHIELVRDVPSKLSSLLLENKLDAALISSIEYLKNKETLDFDKNCCIAAEGKVESIRLFLPPQQEPLDPLATFTHYLKYNQYPEIDYDYGTRSSIGMLKVLVEHFGATKKTTFTETRGPYEDTFRQLRGDRALLLIGDLALKNKDYFSIDLGELYFQVFNKPFVYALWAYPLKSQFDTAVFANAYTYARENWQETLDKAVTIFGFSKEYTQHYLESIITYQFTDSLLSGLDFYFNKILSIE